MYVMLLNKTFQCLILSKKCRVRPEKIALGGVAKTSFFSWPMGHAILLRP